MATAEKHKKRSQRSHHQGIPAVMFASHAVAKKEKIERTNFFKELFRRGNDRGN